VSAAADAVIAAAPVSRKLSADDWIMRGFIVLTGAWMILTVLLPLYFMLSKSVEDHDGAFVGLANFAEYFATPALSQSISNSFYVACLSTAITVSLAFFYAYALTRSAMRGKVVFKVIALFPLLAPSILPAISFVYLFGRQGVLKGVLGEHSIYGPIGIVMGEVFYTFPHALMILVVALGLADARIYEAAVSLRAGPVKTFFTVTLPGIKYGLTSAVFVVFTLVITDFGIPKVIGGWFNVLAVDIYKQDRVVQRRQVALLTAGSVPFRPRPQRVFDGAMTAYCVLVSLCIVGILGMAGFASLVKFWPYDLSLSLRHYNFDVMDGGGWEAFANSLRMALYTALFGTAIIFTGAYMVEKARGFGAARGAIQLLCMLPMAVPGLVLGLAYIFFFNHPDNPLGVLYGTMTILVMVTIAHFYTVSHLTATTALKQIDREFESVSASLKVPVLKTFAFVTVPVCLPAILDISIYLFVNAMTTVSAVIFLYSPTTSLASVAAVNMDDAGDVAPAAAMCTMIVLACATVRIVHVVLTAGLHRSTQAWRKR
jgi:iron(III) transport system permease protein